MSGSAAAEESSERVAMRIGCCAVEFAIILVFAAVLLSTSAPKLSFPGDGSERAGPRGAPEGGACDCF